MQKMKVSIGLQAVPLAAHSHSGCRRIHLATTTQSGSKLASTVYPEKILIGYLL